MACRDIDPRDAFGRGRDLRCRCHRQERQFLGVHSLRGKRVRAGFDDSARLFMKLWRIETDDPASVWRCVKPLSGVISRSACFAETSTW